MSKYQKILLIDDDEATRLLITEILTETGLKVIEAARGKVALGMFATHASEIGLVLTDIKLPDISGYELIKQFKYLNNELPIVAISALPPCEAELKCRKAGATHFLSKPFGIDEFEALLKPYNELMTQACYG
jgi:DNA-binding response OmpR family regulator